jgi:sec-independent protein translocase protein TatA
MTNTLGFIQDIGPMQWLIILIVMLLLFGKRLPEVGKSLGKGIVEFKKGLKEVDTQVEQQSNQQYQPGYNQAGYNNGYQGQLPQNNVQALPMQPMQQQPVQQPMQQPMQHGQPNTVSRADGQH